MSARNLKEALVNIQTGDLGVVCGIVVERVRFNRWAISNKRGLMNLKDAMTSIQVSIENKKGTV